MEPDLQGQIEEGVKLIALPTARFLWQQLAFDADGRKLVTYICVSCGLDYKDSPERLAHQLQTHTHRKSATA